MESHPFVFRPYSSKHSYGTITDHFHSLRSHYINPWGLLGAFLGWDQGVNGISRGLRSFFHLNMYAISQNSYNLADWLCGNFSWLAGTNFPRKQNDSSKAKESSEVIILQPDELIVFPSNFVQGVLLSLSGLVTQPVSWSQSKKVPKMLFWIGSLFGFGLSFGGVLMKVTIGTFRSIGFISSVVAASLRNERFFGDGEIKDSNSRVRSPRFFENKNEKLTQGGDLLVEYVEGENVGLALLSRVKMGSYLSDGYLWHAHEVYAEPPLLSTKVSSCDSIWLERRKTLVRFLCGKTLLDFGRLPEKKVIYPMSILFTKKEILLLSGSDMLCVEWEIPFDEMVSIELETASEGTITTLHLWHVANRLKHRHISVDDYFDAPKTDSVGLGNIQVKSVYLQSFAGACTVVRQIIRILPNLKRDKSLKFSADE